MTKNIKVWRLNAKQHASEYGGESAAARQKRLNAYKRILNDKLDCLDGRRLALMQSRYRIDMPPAQIKSYLAALTESEINPDRCSRIIRFIDSVR